MNNVFISGGSFNSISIGGRSFSGTNISIVNGVVIGGNSSESISGNGQKGEEQREIAEPFDRVDVSAFGKLEIRAGQGKPGIRLSGDSNLLASIKTQVVDRTLHISPKDDANISPTLPLNGVLFAGDLTGITASANSAVVAANIMASKFKASASSGASITVDGKVDTLKAQVSSAGRLNLGGLQAKSADVSASSAGQATVNASEDLDASASSAGSIRYSGAARVEKSTSSAGSVSYIG